MTDEINNSAESESLDFDALEMTNLLRRRAKHDAEYTKKVHRFSFKEIYDLCKEAINNGVRVQKFLSAHDEYKFHKQTNMQNKKMTEQEQRCLDLIGEIDRIVNQMNSMLPIPVDNPQLQEWTSLYDEKEQTLRELYIAVDKCLEKNYEANPLDWANVYESNSNCRMALTVLDKLMADERLSNEEYNIVSRPIMRELTRSREYVIHRIINK